MRDLPGAARAAALRVLPPPPARSPRPGASQVPPAGRLSSDASREPRSEILRVEVPGDLTP